MNSLWFLLKKTPHDLLSFQDIVIATPGRLRDLIEMGVCNLKDVSFAVIRLCDDPFVFFFSFLKKDLHLNVTFFVFTIVIVNYEFLFISFIFHYIYYISYFISSSHKGTYFRTFLKKKCFSYLNTSKILIGFFFSCLSSLSFS